MVKVTDIAHVKFRAPDLDKMEQFLVDFGLLRAHRDANTLYMHGTGADNYIHVTELGPPEFVGMAFNAASREDLELLAVLDGVSAIATIDGPGGGEYVRMSDPDGFEVEVVHGIAQRQPTPVKQRFPLNMRSDYRRRGALVRYDKLPSHVKRLGHAVIFVTDFKRSYQWYQSRLNFLISDEIVADNDHDRHVSAFLRCDRGDAFVDHHTLLTVERPEAGLNHCAFEVEDYDDLQMGNEYLAQRGYEHYWGVGRHFQGSQIFDYWRDPWGRTHEHWTDGDLLNVRSPKGRTTNVHVLDVQWGHRNPIQQQIREEKKSN